MRPLIILADDDPVIRALVELRLSAAGYEVRTFEDGVACIEALRTARPSLIILDLLMPGLSGLGVLDWLRAERRHEGTPVMMLTASADVDDVREAGRRGASGYVLKPFKPDVLAARVERMVRSTGAVWAPRPSHPAPEPFVAGSVLEL